METIRKRWALFVKTDRGNWEAVEIFYALPYRADLAARLVGCEWRVEEIEPEVISLPNTMMSQPASNAKPEAGSRANRDT